MWLSFVDEETWPQLELMLPPILRGTFYSTCLLKEPQLSCQRPHGI